MLDKITELDQKVNSVSLKCRYKVTTADAKFDEFDNALDLINKIRKGKISLTDVNNTQAKFESNLGEIKKAHKNRSKKRKDSLNNIEMLYKARTKISNFMMIILQW